MYGLDNALWLKYQRLQRKALDYLKLTSDDNPILNFDECLTDTLEKWKFLAQWTAYFKTKKVSELRPKQSFRMIYQLVEDDEPLCYEAILYKGTTKTEDACAVCPLYQLNGINCYKKGGIKEIVARPLKTLEGLFLPFTMVKLLRRIKRGDVINGMEYMSGVGHVQ